MLHTAFCLVNGLSCQVLGFDQRAPATILDFVGRSFFQKALHMSGCHGILDCYRQRLGGGGSQVLGINMQYTVRPNLKRNLRRDAIFEIETSPLNGLSNKILADQPEVKKAALTEIEGGAKLELILEEESALASVINLITQKNIKILRLSKREPTLEDVFMELVGQRMEDVEKEEAPDGK